jgi:hypothetical protein
MPQSEICRFFFRFVIFHVGPIIGSFLEDEIQKIAKALAPVDHLTFPICAATQLHDDRSCHTIFYRDGSAETLRKVAIFGDDPAAGKWRQNI